MGVRVTPRRNNIMVCYGYYADYAVSVQSRTSNSNRSGRETDRGAGRDAVSCSARVCAGEKGEMCEGGDGGAGSTIHTRMGRARLPLTD